MERDNLLLPESRERTSAPLFTGSTESQCPSRNPGVVPKATSPRFTQFSKLAPELRIKIWRNALPKPRFIEILRMTPDMESEGYNSLQTEKAPSLFFVCQESRAEVMKLYKPMRGVLGSGSSNPRQSRATTWINFKEDTLCFVYSTFYSQMGAYLNSLPDDIRPSITRIAISSVLINESWNTLSEDLSQRLPNLERLDVVYDGGSLTITDLRKQCENVWQTNDKPGRRFIVPRGAEVPRLIRENKKKFSRFDFIGTETGLDSAGKITDVEPKSN